MTFFRWSVVSILFLALFSPVVPSAEEGQFISSRRPLIDPVKIGERQVIKVSYLGIPGLYVTFEVLPFESKNNRKVYHFKGHVKNSFLLGLFHRVNDTVESFWDYEGLFSHELNLKQNETNLERECTETHDPLTGLTFYKNKIKKGSGRREETEKTFELPKQIQDTFSSFHYLRGLKIELGQNQKVDVASESEVIHVNIIHEKTEKTEFDDKPILADIYKLQKLAPDGTPYPGENRVWLSADETRKLLKFDVKVKIGHIMGTLVEFYPGK